MSAPSSIRTSLGWLSLALALLCGCRKEQGGAPELTVAAAASLRGVLPALVAEFGKVPGRPKVVVAYGASGDLRKQVEGGAPIDAVLFASAAPVDALIASGLAQAASRRVVATNELVLIGPKGAAALTFSTLERLPPGALLAVGEPGAVPAGHYARQVLQHSGQWERLRDRMVLGGDVASVLAYARRGEVEAAIVYRTETLGIAEVVVLDAAPPGVHPEVVAALIGKEASPATAAFLEFLASPQVRKIWDQYGFGSPDRAHE